VLSFFTRIFDSDFMPHGMCYLWDPQIVWVNVVSDSLIALSYMTIPFTLVYFLRKRKDLPFRWMFGMFGLFIVGCGATHVMEVWTLWHGTYRLAGFVKVVTAGASVATAVLLVRLLPDALALPSISDRERLEESIRQQNRELEAQNKLVQGASKMKSEFLANMSHELRTPLNSIIGFAELMHDGKLGPTSDEHREYLGDMLTSSKHLLRLINDVLDLSKIESGKMEFFPEPVNVATVVRELRDQMRPQAASKRIRVDTEVDAQLTEIRVDASKLKQVLYNYLSNALKYTAEEGRVTVRVRAENDHEFCLEVEDTGVGIRQDDLSRLFVEFQQLDTGSAKAYQGTGLGLALTRRLVEAQGGRVGVRSTPGVGSVFSATLPRNGVPA